MKLLIAFLMLVGSSALAETTYPLVCNMSGVDGASWKLVPTSNTIIAGMGFKQSPKKASEGVPEGYCAWTDRGFYANEPTVIAEVLFNSISIYEVDFKGNTLLVPAPAPWIAQSKVRGKLITFKVFATTVPTIAAPVLRIMQ